MIDAHKIIWRGLDSREFDVTAHCSFGGDNGAVSSFLNRENIHTEHYDGRRTIHRSKYNEAFTPRFTLVKQNFSDFTEEENRRVLSWLTSSDKPGWMEVYRDDSNVLTWQCFGNITSLEQYKLGNGRVIGYEFEMETTHPYAFSHKMELTKKISKPTPFVVTSNSDEYLKPIHPTITIKFSGKDIYMPVGNIDPTKNNYVMIPNVIYVNDDGNYYVNIPSKNIKTQLSDMIIISSSDANEGIYNLETYYYSAYEGAIVEKVKMKSDATKFTWEVVAEVRAAVKIENTTAGTSTIVSGAAIGETIILDGANKVISAYTEVNGALVQENRIIGDHFNWEWLPLNYGDNNITITGNCDVKFEWLEPRKVGDL
jgi:hypothetical protein